MSMGKPRDLHKEQEWRRRLRDWQRSGLSVSAFCRRYGLAEKYLYRWRRILAERQRRGQFPQILTLAPVMDKMLFGRKRRWGETRGIQEHYGSFGSRSA